MPNDVTPVELPAAGGLMVRGEARYVSDRWVVLVHDHGEDLDSWRSLPARLAARGISTLAIDLRGHGLSDSPRAGANGMPGSVIEDIRLAIDWAQARGAGTIALVGAGANAAALVDVSAACQIAAVVLLSPDSPGAGRPRPPVAKLIMFGGGSAGASAAAHAWQASSIGETILVDLPTTEQGCGLIHGDLAGQAGEQIEAFLARHVGIQPGEVAKHA
jgi:alpha-beta hydrolase superfamily lysophospholipase